MKKRILSLILTAALVFSLMTMLTVVGSAASEPANRGKIAITDSTFSNGGEAAGEVTVDGSGVAKLKRIAAGNFKIEVNNDNEKSVKAAADSEYLQFRIDISEYSPSTEMHFIVYTRDASFTFRQSYDGFSYQLYIAKEWEGWTTDGYGRFTLPAGFNGYVRIDMSTLGTVDYKNNGFACFAMWSDENPLGGTGKSIYLSDFSLVKGAGLGYTVPTQGTAPKDGGKVAFLSGANANPLPVPDSASAISVVESGSNKMIRVKSKSAEKTFGFDSGTMPTVDASGKQFLQMWVDASEITDQAGNGISLRVFDTDGAVADIYGANDNTDYYLFVNKTWEKHTVSGSACAIPAGFKGYLRVDMNQFKSASAGYIGNGSPVNMAKISGIWVWFSGSGEAVDNAAYVNDICFVNAAAPGTAEEDDSPATADLFSLCAVLTLASGAALCYSRKKH